MKPSGAYYKWPAVVVAPTRPVVRMQRKDSPLKRAGMVEAVVAALAVLVGRMGAMENLWVPQVGVLLERKVAERFVLASTTECGLEEIVILPYCPVIETMIIMRMILMAHLDLAVVVTPTMPAVPVVVILGAAAPRITMSAVAAAAT